MASADDQSKLVDESIERIRELNEQVLEAGRVWGQGFLDAYEQSMRSFADLQERTGEGSNIQWFTEVAKAQAEFTRQVTKVSAEVARKLMT
jgi:hypothetical protein